MLAELIKSASSQHQLITSTQSVELMSQFDAEDLIVVDKPKGVFEFKRLNDADYEE